MRRLVARGDAARLLGPGPRPRRRVRGDGRDGLDDRGYREAQLDAGIVEGRFHLAAYALGIGASGLLFTCVGVPTYRRKDGGRPGTPTAVVTPETGITLPAE